MQLIHLGGHEGVTEFCHQLRLETGQAILVDCGLFQEKDARRYPDLETGIAIDSNLRSITTI